MCIVLLVTINSQKKGDVTNKSDQCFALYHCLKMKAVVDVVLCI